MGAIFSTIKNGQVFYIDGETFKKTSDITYEGMDGFERYLDPIREAKMTTTAPGTVAPATTSKPKKEVDKQEYTTDPATRVQTKNPNFGKRIKKTKVQAASDVLAQPALPPKKVAKR
jgi:hypothetical protein